MATNLSKNGNAKVSLEAITQIVSEIKIKNQLREKLKYYSNYEIGRRLGLSKRIVDNISTEHMYKHFFHRNK